MQHPPQTDSPLARLRRVADRRNAETPEARKISAKQEDDLIAAQEALHMRVDGEAVSGNRSNREKDRFTFLTHILAPEAAISDIRAIADGLGSLDSEAGRYRHLDNAFHDTVTGENGAVQRHD